MSDIWGDLIKMANLIKRIKPGVEFDTPHERGCVVISSPDSDGNFDAYDSDHVACQFHVSMILQLAEDRS